MKGPYPEVIHTDASRLTKKDFTPDVDVRWCPGCADYAILAQVQKTMPTLGVPKENIVFVSGIGCSSRFPYYMDTFGIHGIHGRAPAIATGIKLARPDLDVWVVTGDGDGLSIGGNHMLHLLRRNVGVKVMLFNNQIYGLTKGQYSPTSELGKKTKSTPDGSVDYPVEPVNLALGAGATFIARAIGTDAAGLAEVLKRAAAHKGSAFVEILQNCNIFNDGAYDHLTDSQHKEDRQLRLQHGQPLVFGKNKDKGLYLDNHGRPAIGDAAELGDRLLEHDETSDTLGWMLGRLAYPQSPVPFGVFHCVERPAYEKLVNDQVAFIRASYPYSLQAALDAGETWTVR